MNRKHLLITGLPGVGKTTLIKRLAEELAARQPVGFYTEEIREKGIRQGFALVSFDGKTGILSHVDVTSPFRVGKYGVDIAGFEQFLDSLDLLSPTSRLIIIDEIGKMECLSTKFRTLITEILQSGKPLIATIGLKGGGMIAEIKRRVDVTLFEITPQNRDHIHARILEFLKAH